MGNACGALAVSASGDQAGLPDRDGLGRLLAARARRASLNVGIPGPDGGTNRATDLRGGTPLRRSNASERGTGDRRRRQPDDAGRRGDRPDSRGDALVEGGVARPEHAAAQDDVGIEPAEVDAADHRAGHRHDLVGQPVDDRARDRVARLGRGEDDR